MGAADGCLATAATGGDNLMLTVGPTLDDYGSRVELINVDERYHGFSAGTFFDERGDILRQAGPPAVGIEIAEASDERIATDAGMNSAHCQRQQGVNAGRIVF